MFFDYLLANSWWIWIFLVFLFGIVELFTLEFASAMLSAASLVGLIASLLGTPFWLEVVVSVVAAIALLIFVRPPLLRVLRRTNPDSVTNIDAIVGLEATVTRAAESNAPAIVQLSNGEAWTVVQEEGAAPLALGSPVTVAHVQGASVVVVPRG